MPPSVTIRLPGPPQGKQRHRSRIASGGGKTFARQYADPKTVAYEARLKAAATLAMAGTPVLSGMLAVAVFAYLPIPASWPKRRQAEARARQLRPTTKPDWDNIAKITDALNGVVWGDDASVVDGYVRKFYSDAPELVVQVSVVTPEAA